MDVRLIEDLRCPYCAGAFRVARAIQQDPAGGLRYGLLECRCFVFPVVDGILLLSLAKGYGGAEEALQPYVPLQIAALRYLAQDDVAGLLGWMRRHMPLAAELVGGTTASYLNTATRLDVALEAETNRYLAAQGRYEVVGTPTPLRRARQWLRGVRRRGARVTPELELGRLTSYYVQRFFSPRVNTLAMQLGHLPMQGRILSLCCGHGVFENLLTADGRAQDVVCMDGQFLNLLITRHYAAPDASFICHDVQFPLPFADGFFGGVFSSTCLPEIPAQRSFVREAIRVTAEEGWTMFDSIWNTELGVRRIDATRSYRYCQNFFARLDDYLPFFDECAPAGREVGINIPTTPDRYLSDPGWVFGGARAAAAAGRGDPFVSTLVVNSARFPGYSSPERPWLAPEWLSVSPVFDAAVREGTLQLTRRANFREPYRHFALTEAPLFPERLSLDKARCQSDRAYLLEQYCTGALALLPWVFAADRATLAEATTARSPQEIRLARAARPLPAT